MSEVARKDAPIYVAGHRGMVGSALVRRLRAEGYEHLLLPARQQLDLTCQAQVRDYLATTRPAYVFVAAAKVGGIKANNEQRAEFIYQNLMIEANLIDAAYRAGVRRLMFLGSSCVYPRDCPQPIREEYLLTGPLEQTNEPYAIAKIAGIKLCESYNAQFGTQYLSVMPTNLYGPNDNYDLESSHVLPALIRKAHEAKRAGQDELVVWGSGRPLREFLHVDDLAAACVLLMQQQVEQGLFNVGTGSDVSIRALAELVMRIVGLQGELRFDASKPDGTPRKVLNVDRIKASGWAPKIDLPTGIALAYEDFQQRFAVPATAR